MIFSDNKYFSTQSQFFLQRKLERLFKKNYSINQVLTFLTNYFLTTGYWNNSFSSKVVGEKVIIDVFCQKPCSIFRIEVEIIGDLEVNLKNQILDLLKIAQKNSENFLWIDEKKEEVSRYLKKHGYWNSSVEIEKRIFRKKFSVDQYAFVFKICLNQPICFGSINIYTDKAIPEKYILNQINLPLYTPWNADLLIEAKKKLLQSNLFSSVSINCYPSDSLEKIKTIPIDIYCERDLKKKINLQLSLCSIDIKKNHFAFERNLNFKNHLLFSKQNLFIENDEFFLGCGFDIYQKFIKGLLIFNHLNSTYPCKIILKSNLQSINSKLLLKQNDNLMSYDFSFGFQHFFPNQFNIENSIGCKFFKDSSFLSLSSTSSWHNITGKWLHENGCFIGNMIDIYLSNKNSDHHCFSYACTGSCFYSLQTTFNLLFRFQFLQRGSFFSKEFPNELIQSSVFRHYNFPNHKIKTNNLESHDFLSENSNLLLSLDLRKAFFSRVGLGLFSRLHLNTSTSKSSVFTGVRFLIDSPVGICLIDGGWDYKKKNFFWNLKLGEIVF